MTGASGKRNLLAAKACGRRIPVGGLRSTPALNRPSSVGIVLAFRAGTTGARVQVGRGALDRRTRIAPSARAASMRRTFISNPGRMRLRIDQSRTPRLPAEATPTPIRDVALDDCGTHEPEKSRVRTTVFSPNAEGRCRGTQVPSPVQYHVLIIITMSTRWTRKDDDKSKPNARRALQAPINKPTHTSPTPRTTTATRPDDHERPGTG